MRPKKEASGDAFGNRIAGDDTASLNRKSDLCLRSPHAKLSVSMGTPKEATANSLVSPIEKRYLCHMACREAHPLWDDLLNKLSKCKNKSQKRAVFIEHYNAIKQERLKNGIIHYQ